MDSTLLALVVTALPELLQPCGTPEGCVVTLPPGEYRLTEPVVLCGESHVQAYGAVLRFTDESGIVFRRDRRCDASESTWHGGKLEGTVTSTQVRPSPVGVQIEAGLVRVEDVRVFGFVRGVAIFGSLGSHQSRAQKELGFRWGERAHANMWRLDNVSAAGALLDGVFVAGADANAGVATAVNSFTNCRRAHSYVNAPDYRRPDVSGGRCANIQDVSFLGNTWVGPHSARSVDSETKTRFHQYLADGSNGRSVWLGAYSEQAVGPDHVRGNGPSYMRGYGHQVYGGLNQIEVFGGGLRFSEWGRFTRLSTETVYEGRRSELCMGCVSPPESKGSTSIGCIGIRLCSDQMIPTS